MDEFNDLISKTFAADELKAEVLSKFTDTLKNTVTAKVSELKTAEQKHKEGLNRLDGLLKENIKELPQNYKTLDVAFDYMQTVLKQYNETAAELNAHKAKNSDGKILELNTLLENEKKSKEAFLKKYAEDISAKEREFENELKNIQLTNELEKLNPDNKMPLFNLAFKETLKNLSPITKRENGALRFYNAEGQILLNPANKNEPYTLKDLILTDENKFPISLAILRGNPANKEVPNAAKQKDSATGFEW